MWYLTENKDGLAIDVNEKKIQKLKLKFWNFKM